MLNINYENPRKFLMSLGITMIFFAGLLFFGSMVVYVERFDIAGNILALSQNETLANDYVKGLSESSDTILPFMFKVEGVLFFIGLGLLIAGIVIWFIEDNSNKGTFG